MAAASTQRTARTPDGRTSAIEEAEDPGGRPVLVHNGTPNSRHLYVPIAADAAARGRRLIGYDRPGYGGSTPQPAAPWLTARPASVPSGGSLVTQAEQSGCEGYVVVPTATTNIRRDLILHARRQLNRERRVWTTTRSSA
jgi:pimeloyl-ACP methyl ester carboxylesterase